MHTLEPKLFVESQNGRQIASGIAHNCDDLLMVILENAELLSMGTLSPETRKKYIGRIESATRQIRKQIDRATHSQVARDQPKAMVSRD